MDSSRYDVLIFTARTEEMYFLAHYFAGSPDPLYSDVERASPDRSFGLSIGLLNMGVMGNQASIIACEAFERLLPRSALMVGLAAGYKPQKGMPPLNRGDVGISKEIIYHSYGKVRGAHSLPDIRHAGAVVRDEYIKSNWVEQCARDVGWKSQVSDWFAIWNDELLRWEEGGKTDELLPGWLRTVNGKDRHSYLPQMVHDINRLKAEEVNMASGELVIASEEYVKHIRDSYNAVNVAMFDMESYAIGQVARHYGIPFYTIKGISDFADSPPGPIRRCFQSLLTGSRQSGKDDNYRLAAIAGSSALCLHMLQNGFREQVVDRSRASRPNAAGIRKCLHPNGSVICPHVYGDMRKCVSPGDMIYPETVAWLTRTIEGMTPLRFSRSVLEKFPEFASDPHTSITSFFPFSARDLVRFIERDTKPRNRRAAGLAGELLRLYNDKSAIDNHAELVSKIHDLAGSVSQEYGHFMAWNKVSGEQGLGTKMAGVQPCLARVVLFDVSEIPSEEDIMDDPLNLIYPLVLGKDVRTFYSSVGRLMAEDAIADDVTFLDRRCGRTPTDETEHGDCVAIRFFSQSRTLLISGIPCSLVRNRVNTNNGGLDKLYLLWQNHWNRADVFRPFPLEGIWNRYMA